MSSQTPIVRQISWPATLPQLAAVVIAAIIGYWLAGVRGMCVGSLVYLTYSVGSRIVIPQAHRAGIRLLCRQQYGDAIAKFRESLEFFEKHAWIDQYRSIVLMSPSAISYREMALANVAFCYGQLGNGAECRRWYQKCFEMFPESGLATSALRMLDAVATEAPK